MTASVRVIPLTSEEPPATEAALFLHQSPVGAHVGVLYRATDDGVYRLLHQAWHYDSRNDDLRDYAEELGRPIWWVLPALDEDELADLCAHAELIGRRLRDAAIPYALDPRNASINAEGVVDLGRSLGLTCATFVLQVFDAACVKLLHAESWDEARSATRREEDAAAQRFLVHHLRGVAPDHAARVECDIGCTRVRAEEVGAASGITTRPAPFSLVEPEGRKVLEIVAPGAGAARPTAHPRERLHRL